MEGGGGHKPPLSAEDMQTDGGIQGPTDVEPVPPGLEVREFELIFAFSKLLTIDVATNTDLGYGYLEFWNHRGP